ncbi:MAG: winged helix-turn-helix transcriptional regulator [Clostridium sp.]|nr:winged helix-turn-helix transcriptional regulator [Clostridium sp.]
MGDNEAFKNSLNETQRRILEEIRNNPNITKKQIQDRIDKGKTTIDNGIAYLKEIGLIEHIGSNKSGYWTVLKESIIISNIKMSISKFIVER